MSLHTARTVRSVLISPLKPVKLCTRKPSRWSYPVVVLWPKLLAACKCPYLNVDT